MNLGKKVATFGGAAPAAAAVAGLGVGNQLQLTTSQSAWEAALRESQAGAAKAQSTATRYDEAWADLSGWTTPVTPGVQVSSGRMYSVGTRGAGSGATHALDIGASGEGKITARFYHNTASGGGIIIGFSSDAVGETPGNAGANAKGVYFSTTNLFWWSNGSGTALSDTITTGFYTVTIIADADWVSATVQNEALTSEWQYRVARGTLHTAYLFNSSSLALTGSYVDEYSCADAITSLSADTVARWQWYAGNGSAYDFRVSVPASYDAVKPSPLAVLFHGNGSDCTHWASNANGKVVADGLVAAGYVVLGVSYPSNLSTWGAQASLDAYRLAFLRILARFSISGVVFYGNSMGGIESLLSLGERRIPCHSWAGTVPAVSLKSNYDAGFGSVIRTAYGIAADGSDYASKTAGHDPALIAPYSFRGVPMYVLAATDDVSVIYTENTVVLEANVAGWSEFTKETTTGGHSTSFAAYVAAIVAHFNSALLRS